MITTGAAYAPALGSPFYYDDWLGIARNYYVRAASALPHYLLGTSLDHAGTFKGLWRPVTILSYFGTYAVAGVSPTAFHLVDVGLHLVAAAILWALFRSVAIARQQTAVAVAIFALHPLQTEAVTYAWGRSEQLATVFAFTAMLSYARGRAAATHRCRRTWLGLAALSFAFALASKESAFFCPFLILAVELFGWHGGSLRGTLRDGRMWARLSPLLMLAVSYILWRNALFGAVGQTEPSRGVGVWSNMLTQGKVICMYLGLFAVPARQTLWWEWPRTSELLQPGVIAAVVLLGFLGCVAVAVRKSRPALALGIVWFFVALAPSSSVVPITIVMQEYRMYAAVAGLGLVCAALLLSASPRPPLAGRWVEYRRWVGGRPLQRTGAVVAALAIAAMTTATLKRNLVWADEAQLYHSAVEVAPWSATAQQLLAGYLELRSDLLAAEEHARIAHALDPWRREAQFPVVAILLSQGRVKSAETEAARALKTTGWTMDAYLAFGRLAAKKGELEGAESYYRKALALDPQDVTANFYFGNLHLQAGRFRQAGYFLQRAHERDPLHVNTIGNLGVVAFQTGDFVRARAHFEQVLLANPESAIARDYLSKIREKMGE
ncbi:MAG: tetratricopeptide repeat protein [Candidatus Schekmanbacteria bacterium]|nr:tetratricopeptide repeat protein [Candidatus Schekmanbacteria bacterium]